MKPNPSLDPLLIQMSRIPRMERGRLCRLNGRPDFNHQTWQDGRNVVRYVPRNQADEVQRAIEGYLRYQKLAEQYADKIIRKTRRAHLKSASHKPSNRRPQA